MKKIFSIFILSVIILSTSGQVANHDSAVKENNIVLLGTYHFDNPNQDQFNVQSDNVLSEKRQKEVEQLAAMLAKFTPTHVALEFNAIDTALDQRYQRYLKGQYTLRADEREQLGFRVAKILGHKQIYPVDAPDIQLDFNPGELANEYAPLLEELGKEGNGVMNEINKWLEKYTIGEILARLNTKQFDLKNMNMYYKYLLPIGKGETQPGVDAITKWYKRNLLILHNIMKLSEGKSGQRILIIFRQGHTAIHKQMLQYSTVFKKEDIHKYLPAIK